MPRAERLDLLRSRFGGMGWITGSLLAEVLAGGGGHERAFARYESRMRPEVTRRQRNAALFARSLVPGGRAGLVAQGLVNRLIMRETFAPLLRRQFGAGSILPPPAGLGRDR
ncbi:hypothetical protein ACIBIZ_35610 [Nonomuraea spiralis]|uniref:hypothetical protein n=1 Tax=Nonomuraea TaxID=83681 RepID=UPI001C8C7823|nr:hypothetical protein [Nonomuraea sp. WAC 01424]